MSLIPQSIEIGCNLYANWQIYYHEPDGNKNLKIIRFSLNTISILASCYKIIQEIKLNYQATPAQKEALERKISTIFTFILGINTSKECLEALIEIKNNGIVLNTNFLSKISHIACSTIYLSDGMTEKVYEWVSSTTTSIPILTPYLTNPYKIGDDACEIIIAISRVGGNFLGSTKRLLGYSSTPPSVPLGKHKKILSIKPESPAPKKQAAIDERRKVFWGEPDSPIPIKHVANKVFSQFTCSLSKKMIRVPVYIVDGNKEPILPLKLYDKMEVFDFLSQTPQIPGVAGRVGLPQFRENRTVRKLIVQELGKLKEPLTNREKYILEDVLDEDELSDDEFLQFE